MINRQARQAYLLSNASIVTSVPFANIKSGETTLSDISGTQSLPSAIIRARLKAFAIYDRVSSHESAEVRTGPIARYEQELARDGQNLVNVLHTLYTENRHFEEALDNAMSAAFGSEYIKLLFPPAADQRVQMRIRWKSLQKEQNATAISDGTLHYLFLIAALANPDPPRLIAIDEPETGLHPRMFRIIAEYAAEAARKTQVIFTTHSPEFLDAFTDAKPTVTVAQWVNGETKLSIPDPERLEHWLKSYSLGEMFRANDLENLVEV